MPGGIHWRDAQAAATSMGAYLATLSSSQENGFVFGLVDSAAFWIDPVENDTSLGPWIGGLQPPGSVEPAGGWTWVTGEPMTYTNWGPGQPNNSGDQDRIHLWTTAFPNRAGTWNDLQELRPIAGYIMERDTPPQVCGDGILAPGETCDDGNNQDGDGCRSDCTLEQCGDGTVDPGEACDDGNNVGGDGCRSDCTREECGDGIVDPGEACDDGNQSTGDGCRPIARRRSAATASSTPARPAMMATTSITISVATTAPLPVSAMRPPRSSPCRISTASAARSWRPYARHRSRSCSAMPLPAC